MLVKFIGLGNAGGEIAEPTAIISVSGFGENEFFAERIKTFTASSTSTEGGWLYAAKSRAGCAAMWQHWFSNHVVPSINISKNIHQHKVNHTFLDCENTNLIYRTLTAILNEYSSLQTVKPLS